MSSSAKLFQPIQVGAVPLQHRVVLAPLTRVRADLAHVHSELAVDYYSQRASTPGTLLISEATLISPRAGGLNHVPGIWSDAQVEAWKKITTAVHAKGSYIFLQLGALGRAAIIEHLEAEDPTFPYVSASDIKLTSRSIAPRPLTTDEIKQYVEAYATAASRAVYEAGFDGVEIHGANGYLLDQFLQDVSNNRTDEYGGSVESRCRIVLEVAEAIVCVIGANRTGLRLSPWRKFQDMRMENPIPTFSHLIQSLAEKYPEFAYLHLVDPRFEDVASSDVPESNDCFRKLWSPRPFISAGGFDRSDALVHAERTGDLIAFGRHFIANPDLPRKLREDLPLTSYDRSTFYTPGAKGYTDYPFAE